MRALALLSAVAVTASLAVTIPGSVSEEAALASTPQTCVDRHGTAEPALLDGSTDTYVIDSVQKLVYLSDKQDENVPETSHRWRTRNFIQTAPIDLGGCSWTPIGADDADFTGEYDGGGFPIHNLTIPSGTYSGLFGSTVGATITGVHLLDADLNQAGSFSGTLVGQAWDTTISDSSATGSISATGNNVGGLVGVAFGSTTISRSFSTVTVTRASGSGLAYGGLVGDLRGSSIESSFATGAVSAGDRTGGLAGSVGETSTISNSYARGAVTGDDKVGGLIGALLLSANLTVTNSYATGKVSKVEGTTGKLGGLIGGKFDSVTLTVTNSFWDKDTTEQNATLDNKGSGQTTTNMKSLSTFSDWPIVEGWQSFDPANNRVWGIRSVLNDGYPYFLWEYETEDECAFVHGTAEPALVDGSIDTYVIDSAGKLVYLSVNQNTGSPAWRTRNFIQTAPIDLQGCLWTPVGTSANPFSGQYTGGGHPISNLTIVGATENAGLFGRTVNATIERAVLDNVDIRDNTAADGVGALVGFAEGTTISRSSAEGAISGASGVIGGLVGRLNSSGGGDMFRKGSIEFSRAAVNVTSTGTVTAAGGLAGRISNSTVENSYAIGDVAGGDKAGGLIGEITILSVDETPIANSYAIGKVTGASTTGGLLATANSGGNVTNSFWDTQTTTQNTSAFDEGFGRETSAMNTLSTFSGAGWSIASCRTTGEDTVWGILPGGYPFLTWQDSPQLATCETPAPPSASSSQSSPSTRPDPTPDPTVLEPVAPVTPQPFGGTSTNVVENDADPESTLEVPVTVDEAPDPDAEGAGGDPAVAGSDSDTEVLGVGQTSGNSAWLWAIGLGGLGAAALIAGGVAFARLRP